MGWEKLLKRRTRTKYTNLSRSDIALVNYILRDGEFKTVKVIIDEIYDLIAENKRATQMEISRTEGRPYARTFRASREQLKQYMTMFPAYESRDTGKKTAGGSPIKQYRYIGE